VADAVARDWVVSRIPLQLETVTGLRVSGERDSGLVGSDLPLLKLPDGRPYIPGSSVKGVLRAAAERLLASRGIRVCDILDEDRRCGGRGRRDDPPVAYGHLCWPCQLFGSPHWAGRLWAADLVPDAVPVTIVRDGVAIDRGELKAADRRKYDYEVLPPGVALSGEVRIDDPEPGDLGLVLTLWDLVDEGIVTFGGGASRGLGRLRVMAPPRPRLWRASSWQPGSQPAELDRNVLLGEFRARIEGESAMVRREPSQAK
jgi:CRISPR-associated protein Csm3